MNKLSICQEQRERVLPVLSICIGQVIWGFSYLFTRIAQRWASPDVVLSMRFLAATLIMTALILCGKGSFSLKGKNFRVLLGLALLEPPYYFFESYGVYYSNATFAGTVMAFAPVVGIAAAVVFLGERPSRRQKIFYLLPTAGVIIMTAVGSSMGIIKPLGVVFLFASQIVAAAMKLFNKKSSEEFSAFERTYAIMISNAIIFTTKSMIDLRGNIHAYVEPLKNTEYVFALIMLCIFCGIVANLLVNYACGMMSVTKISTFSTIATICSAFGGVLLLHEPITWMTFLGSALIIVGIWQVTRNAT